MTYLIRMWALIFLLASFAVVLLPSPVHAAVHDRYWVNGTGNWTDTAHWSATSSGAGGASVPTSEGNAHFDAFSFVVPAEGKVVTVDAAATCLDMDWTGATNTPTLTANAVLRIYGSITTILNMTFNGASTIELTPAGGTTKYITSNGLVWGTTDVAMYGPGTTELAQNWNAGNNIVIRGGTFNTANFSVTVSAFQSDVGVRTINLGSSTITVGTAWGPFAFWTMVPAGLTLNTGTSVINYITSGVSFADTFNGGGLTYNTVNFSGTSSYTITGSNTFANLSCTGPATKTDTLTLAANQVVTGTLTLAGNSTTNRLLVQSDTLGTQRTLTAAVVTASNVDLMDIKGAGAGSWNLAAIAGGSGDCGGNDAGITFTASAPQTFANGGVNNNYSTVGNWGVGRVPLPQDDVAIGTGDTVDIDMPRIGRSITCTGTPTVSLSNDVDNYGSFTLVAGMTWTHNSKTSFLRGRGVYTITSAGKAFGQLVFKAPTGVYTLQDDYSVLVNFLVYSGTVDLNDKSGSSNSFQPHKEGAVGSTVYFGNGVITILDGVYYADGSATVYAEGSTIVLSSTIDTGFYGASKIYNNVRVEGAGVYTLTVAGANTFNTFTVDRSAAAKTIKWPASTTNTFTRFLSPTATTTLTTFTSSTPGTKATLSFTNRCNLDYLNATDITATGGGGGYYGQNSTMTTCSGWNAVDFRYWRSNGGNWSDNTNHWSTTSGGAGGASLPTSATCVRFDANSFAAPAQTVTVDAVANCRDMDWTYATNTPTFAGSSYFNTYGNITWLAAGSMVSSYSGEFSWRPFDNTLFDSKGLVFANTFNFDGTGKVTLLDTLNAGGNQITFNTANLDTNGKTVTCGYFTDYGSASAKTVTLGASTLNCTQWSFTGGLLTLTANTATINVSGIGNFAGGNATTYNNVNLNGTAHTVSGNNTFVNLTRNGTATKTDTLTLTVGTVQTITGVCNLHGNSVTNRLLVQSSILGTRAYLHPTSWTGTDAVDFMDISSYDVVDLSNVITYPNFTGDCGGNEYITFTTSAAQTWGGATGSWSDVTKWGAGRVPLPQDDVSAPTTNGTTITVDMPRIGRSITFTGVGTGIVSFTSTSGVIDNYGSLILNATMAYTPNGRSHNLRGRTSGLTLMPAGNTFIQCNFLSPNGAYTLQGAVVATDSIAYSYGDLDLNDKNVTTPVWWFYIVSNPVRTLSLGNGTITLTGLANVFWYGSSQSNLTINAEGSTIIITRGNADAYTFEGGGKTYNNVTVQGAGAYALTITGNNTFNTFTVDRSAAAKTITVTAGSTQTFANFVSPTSGITATTINSTGAAANFVKTGGGDIAMDYLNLSNNTASPANTWHYMTHSTVGVGVTGWQDGTPYVTTNAATLVEETTVTLNGIIDDLNYGGNATVRGYQYDIDSGAPYAFDIHSNGSFGIGAFTEGPTMVPGQIYYYRAYATNPIATTYNGEQSFLTKPNPPTAFTYTPASSTSFNLSWVRGTGADTTMVRWKVGSYPTSVTDGTLGYNDVGSSTVIAGLIPDQTYYFKVWSVAVDGGYTQYSDDATSGTTTSPTLSGAYNLGQTALYVFGGIVILMVVGLAVSGEVPIIVAIIIGFILVVFGIAGLQAIAAALQSW